MQWSVSIPQLLWLLVVTVVAAGAIAVFGAWLGNRNSRRQLAMQLTADREQRERDRSMAVRREVYIPAAEAISRIQTLIGGFSDPAADQTSLSRRITTDLGSLARISVLGTDATVFAVSRLTSATMLAFLQLTAMRQKLLQRSGRLKTAVAARDAAVTQRQQIAELLRQGFVSGNRDPALLRRLQEQFDRDTKAAEARQTELERLLEEQTDEERELSLRIVETNQEVLKHVPDALIAVRRELELPVDEAALRRMFSEQQAAALEIARHLLEHTGANARTSQASTVHELAIRMSSIHLEGPVPGRPHEPHIGESDEIPDLH
jgi:ribosomal protein L3